MADTATACAGTAASVVVPAAAAVPTATAGAAGAAGAGTIGSAGAVGAAGAADAHAIFVAAAVAAWVLTSSLIATGSSRFFADLYADATLAGAGVGAKRQGADDFSKLEWSFWQPGGPEAAHYLHNGALRTV